MGSKSIIDISIKNFKDYLTDMKLLKPYLKMNCKVTQKSDGVKIVLIYTKKGWEVHYKDTHLKQEIFDGMTDEDLKHLPTSTGYAQYIKIFKHLENVKASAIPYGTKFFCEFIMKKATLTRSYKETGALVLLCVNNNWNDKETEHYAKILNLRTPRVLAEGNFQKVILPKLDDFMNMESVFGGIEEGIVLTFENGEKFKLLQPDQHDVETRRKKKLSFYDTPEYYEKVNEIIRNLDYKKDINWNYIKTIKLPHSDKLTPLQQIEDALERALRYKSILEKGIGLIVGKFRIFTKEHENLVKKALKDKDIKKVVICCVTGKDTEFSQALRIKMLNAFKNSFKTNKEIEIIEHNSANLFGIFRKLGTEALKLYCGTDRVESYKNLLKSNFTQVIETPRNADAISATKVLANLDDKKAFEKSASTSLKSLYDEIKAFYTK